MPALIKVSQFLYFLLLMIFLVFIVIFQKSPDSDLHIHIVMLFTFLLLPVFDRLISIFVKEKRIFDGRILFAMALIVFCYISMYLIFGQNAYAETLYIYAYYLLIAGVVAQILENIISSKKNKNV